MVVALYVGGCSFVLVACCCLMVALVGICGEKA